MTADRSSGFRPLGVVPVDLAVIVAVTVLVNVAVFAPVVRTTPLRVPLGILFVFFVPGYVLVATLFPESGRRGADEDASAATRESRSLPSPVGRSAIDGLERAVLSFGLSVAIVPGFALFVNYTSWGIQPVSIVAGTTIVTLLLTVTATVRRLNLPAEERFRLPVRRWSTMLRTESVESTERAETVLTLLLLVSIFLAVGSVGYAVTTSQDGEQFSELYLLGEDGDELSADGYPTEFEQGESRDLVVGVENNEHRTTDYTIIAVEQAVESTDGEPTVTDQRELDRFETRLDHGETWRQDHEVEPTMAGENVRLVWLVYLDDTAPESPSMETAPYHVHVWADVGESNAES
ncbi:DUF1616 domain-containing protein [Natrinema salifodinae]|uniref:Uncharacterized membrane protein n=1 Tax=Natrinema salifodinae TaxID=1202768 RepID=A0A1I0LYV4_9EURY|nr:DUF1616 domain-containing protein [Natrinema salifodinae]SEV81066.1 Uncharacterized membrane protein [Natrinema salifodinae]